jgi:hypothetical protein
MGIEGFSISGAYSDKDLESFAEPRALQSCGEKLGWHLWAERVQILCP